MILADYLDRKLKLLGENILLKLGFVVLLIIQVFNHFDHKATLNNHTTIITPPTVTSTIKVIGGKPDQNYYREITRYIHALGFNYTPKLVRGQFDELLGLYSPVGYPGAREDFLSLADQIEHGGLSSVFYPMGDIEIDESAGRIKVTGKQILFSENGYTKSFQKTFILMFSVNNGKFELLGIGEPEDIPTLENRIAEAKEAGGEH